MPTAVPTRSGEAAPPLRLRWLLAAPHRLCFFAAALMLAGSALWWATLIVLRAQGVALVWAVTPSLVHGLVMGYGFIPLFFCGFLFTAGPKWLARPAVPAGPLVRPVAGCLLGWLTLLAGAPWSAPLAAAGVALAGAGFGVMCWRFVRLLSASTVDDTRHAALVACACSAGVGVLALAATGLALGNLAVVRAALHGGLWLWLALVYVVVVHRMVPFFTAAALPVLDAWRPLWLLWTLSVVVALQGPLAMLPWLFGPLPAWVHILQAGVAAPAAALLLALALRWGLVQSLKVRLVAMLHTGFLWLGVALALEAASQVLLAASGGTRSLGLAPTHALTMGFFGSTLLAMVTRVSCGHGGRALVADDIVWRLFWLLQLAIVARVAAALWPAAATPLTTLAALAWTGWAVAWALRYTRWYLRPRPDGRPG